MKQESVLMPSQPSTPTPKNLQALLIKQGVMLGGLTLEQRAAALAVVWAGLPDGVMTEKQINGVLQQRLSAAAQFLDTDHVELRRWLVDTGWLQRDGFGHAYQRLALAQLAPPLAQAAALVPAADVDTWAHSLRQAQAQAHARQERRLAWQHRSALGQGL